MNLKTYKNCYNGVPSDLESYAEGAKSVIDCSELSERAIKYLDAKWEFERILNVLNIEIG